MLVPVRPPFLLRQIGNGMTWSLPGGTNTIYLTFDDGPIPEVTPMVLDVLGTYQAKATFFCVGANAERNPALLHRIREEGHAVGNHTHNHLDGWKTRDKLYFRNISRAQHILRTTLFRPPYGRITPSQLRILRNHYRIIMWSVLTQDYNRSLSAEKCLQNSLKAGDGNIVVFHDSIKAVKNLEYALPRFLDHYSGKGYNFSVIS